MSTHPRFQVYWLPRVKDFLKKMGRTASLSGRKLLADVLRDIDTQLADDPISLGEVYRTRAEIVEHLAVYKCRAIDFAVDLKQSQVLVRQCQPLSGHRFD